jgi:outer membrane protein OmpA-like peptidoglycan-associated protein
MKRGVLTITFCLAFVFAYSQRQAQKPLANGDIVNQTLKLFDSTNSQIQVEIPSENNMLFYRFRGYNWFTDTKDSIELAEKIFQDIVKEAPSLKKLRVICYGYNLDNFLTNKEKPVFKNDTSYKVEYYFLNNRTSSSVLNSGKLCLIDKHGRVLATSQYLANFTFTYKPSDLKLLKAKLITEKNGMKVPLVNARIYFFSSKRDTVSTATTNKYGDFEIATPDDGNSASLNVQPADKNVKSVILATQEGREISKFEKTANGFEYKFIHAEIIKFTDVPVDEDISLMVKEFATTSSKEFKKTEDINYDLAKYELTEESKKKLDKLGRTLMENQNIKLEVISHTDSQGDDAKNMELSEKRSVAVIAYLIFIGVNKTRLKAVGKGETQIRNRCKNNVDCSDIEHRYNRRTEFKFMKD